MSRIFSEIISKRGLSEDFLRPKYLSRAGVCWLLPDMKSAIKEILEAIKAEKKIMVYGDYDVDGVTSTTLMVEALVLAGAKEVITMLPDRFIDGYGMGHRCVERAKKEKIGLIVTVDCGSNNSEVIDELLGVGISTVVTDHHEIMGELPKALAVVNPKRKDLEVDGDLTNLAGVGVAFMVARALVEEGVIPDGREKWLLDLVLIGTLCDSMRISQINRELTYYGLKVLEKTKRIGLKELMKKAGVNSGKIGADSVGFQIGPRLNAGGRMESAEIALKLLMAKNKIEAVKYVEQLEKLNERRREEQQAAVREIEKMNKEIVQKVIVVTGEWHEGVLGIIAGRLVEKYHKPAFVLTKTEDGYKGSGRSFGEFNLAKALKKCSKFIVGGGGHAGACGVRVADGKVADFRNTMNRYYEELRLEDQRRFLVEQAEIYCNKLTDLSMELLDEISQLEPFGEGNREPIFGLEKMTINENKRIGKDKNHLKMQIKDENGDKMNLLAFSAPDKWFSYLENEEIVVTARLIKNEWNGGVFVEGKILEIEKTEVI